MRKKNVVFFLTGLDSGGLENYLLRFLNLYSERFGKVFIFCKGGKGGQLESKYSAFNNVIILKQKIGYYNFKDYWMLGIFLKRENVEIVCDFTGDFSGGVLWVAEKKGVMKRIAFYRNTSHRFKGSLLKNKYAKLVNNLTYKFATNILSNSKLAFDFFYEGKQLDSRFQVIHNGINALEFSKDVNTLHKELGIPENSFVIGHVGRYNEAKNHKLLIELANEIAAMYDDIYFLFCGNGVKSNLSNKINNNVVKKVFLFENRNDISSVLNTLDLFLFPSFTEGQPNALIEAAVLGVPFIASNIEPIKETVSERYFECLLDAEDFEGFKNRILKYYKRELFLDDTMSAFFIRKFNHKVLFSEFLKVLNNE